jgi:uncharacterized protein (TIGR03437 family)
MYYCRALAFFLLSFPLSAQRYRAFWADAFHAGYKTPAQADQLIADLVAARANAVFVEVRRRGDSYYLHSLEPPAEDPEFAPGFDALAYLVDRANARGIEVHAWFPVSNVADPSAPPRDPRHVWNRHGPRTGGADMWMTVSSGGRISGTSLDPGHPDALRYLAAVILEPARHYNLDGLHLDYIRYPEDADYGWNPTAIARFQRLANRTGNPDPRDPAWADFRRKQITDLVRQIYLRAYAIRPSVKISAALITWGSGPRSDQAYRVRDAYSRVFQDWRVMLEEGILDLGIPMNYFRESVPEQAEWFNQWIEFEKDRQYGRAILIGPAIYLNAVPDSMAQIARAMAPSNAGNRVFGVNFYSYASTNSTGAPNPEFYRTIADRLGEAAAPPVLSWKTAPSRGHVYGWLQVNGGPAWLNDGASIFIESATGARTIATVTDGTGFFGAVDLAPDRYRVRVERAGVELYRSPAQDVAAGAAVRFDVALKELDFARAMPVVRAAGRPAGSPGDVVSIAGTAFGSVAVARAVPLPIELGRTQVVVNGVAAPLFQVSPESIEFQLPYVAADEWIIVVRNAGLESQPFRLEFRQATPVITGVRNRGDGYLEIYATGLGPVTPAIQAGLGGLADPPYNRTVLPVTVLLDGSELQPVYSGLAPYIPGRYQVNVAVPPGFNGEVRLRVGDIM